MKKVFSMVLAGIMVMMLMVTGCNSKTNEERIETVKTFKRQLDDGMCSGHIQYVRYGVYGSGAYEYCVMTHDYHKSLGELVTDIDCEYVNDELIWYFYAANIAE